MKSHLSQETKFDLLKLGIYQIGGGVIGIGFILWMFTKPVSLNEISIVLTVLMILFFCYSIYCGISCLYEKENCLKHSMANQCLQLIGFYLGGFAYQYIAGIYFTIGIDLTNQINFNLGFGISTIKFTMLDTSETIKVELNLVAFTIILWINNSIIKLKSERDAHKVKDLLSN